MAEFVLAGCYLLVIVAILSIHLFYGSTFFAHDTRLDIGKRNIDEYSVKYYSDFHGRLQARFPGDTVRVLRFPGIGEGAPSRHIMLSQTPVSLDSIANFPDLSISVDGPVHLDGEARLPYVFCREFRIGNAGHSFVGRMVVDGPADISAEHWESTLLLASGHVAAHVGTFKASQFGATSYSIVPNASKAVVRDDEMEWQASTPVLLIPPGTRTQEPVITQGSLDIGAGALIDTSVKVHGDVRLGEDVVITGSLVVGHSLTILDGCQLRGDVVVHGELSATGSVQFGDTAGRSVSVVFRNGRFNGPLFGHGYIIAEVGGGLEVGNAHRN